MIRRQAKPPKTASLAHFLQQIMRGYRMVNDTPRRPSDNSHIYAARPGDMLSRRHFPLMYSSITSFIRVQNAQIVSRKRDEC